MAAGSDSLEIRDFRGIHTRRILKSKEIGTLINLENLITTEEGHLQCRGGVNQPKNRGTAFSANQYKIVCTANGTAVLTTAASFSSLLPGDWLSGPGVNEGTYVLTVDSPTQITIAHAWDATKGLVTAGTEPAERVFWRSQLVPYTYTGKVVGAHTHRSARPYVFHGLTTDVGGTMSPTAIMAILTGDLSEKCWWDLFNGTAAGNLVLIVAGHQFSSFTLDVAVAKSAGMVLDWYYGSASNGWQPLTLSETFATTGVKNVTFPVPRSGVSGYTYNWGEIAIRNGVRGFAILGRIKTTGATPQVPRFQNTRIHGDFPPRYDLVLATSDVVTAVNSARVHRFGHGYSDVTRHFPVDLGATDSGMSSGFDAPMRFSTNDGVLYYTNGSILRRHQGDPKLNADVGFPKPAYPATALDLVKSGAPPVPIAGELTGVFAYGLRYGYGPNGAWGKGTCIQSTDAGWTAGSPAVGCAANQVRVTFPTEVSSLQSGIVDVIYVYRSVDLTGAKAMTYPAVPFFKVGEVTRQSDGTFPAYWDDNYKSYLKPLEALDIRDFTPPQYAKWFGFHKNRAFWAGSREFPSRVWRSQPNEWEACDQSEYVDFARMSGGDLTALCPDYADMIVCFTEDSMYGISSFDSDDWTAQLITNEVGCIAPESVVAAYGYLFWLAKSGVWKWDGDGPPELISKPVRIENCSTQNHRWSRAVAYNFLYEIELIAEDKGFYDRSTEWPSAVYSDLSDARASSVSTKYVYSLKKKEWQVTRLGSKLFGQPIACVTQPPYALAAGRRAPLYGRFREKDVEYLYIPYWIGDSGTLDDSTAISFTLDIPLGPYGDWLLKPFSLFVETKGITSITAVVANSTTIGYKPTLVSAAGTKLKDSSDTYDIWEIPFSDMGNGTGDLIIRLYGTVAPSYERQAFIYAVSLAHVPVKRHLMGVGVSGV